MAGWFARLLGRRATLEAPLSLLPGEDDRQWQSAFQDAALLADSLRQLEGSSRRLSGHLGWAYAAQERLSGRYLSLLLGVVVAVEFCDDLDPAPPAVQALRHQLLAVLAGHGVEAWSPPPGQLMPEGCEAAATTPTHEHPPGTVERVLRPGYRLGATVLRRPKVLVAVPDLPDPDPNPGGET